MSLTRNTLAAVLCAVAVTLALAACGRNEPDLSTGKAQFVEKCGSCHALARAGTAGTQGPSLDTAFQTALADGFNRETIQGIVHDQILNPRRNSSMPADLVTGEDAVDVAAYVAYAAAKSGDDQGALASAGLAQAKTGEQIFTAAGCAGCHTFSPAGSNATIGPELNDLKAAAAKYAKGQTPEEYVRESMVKPDAFIVPGFGNAMPSFEGRLTDKQLQTLVDYLLNSGG